MLGLEGGMVLAWPSFDGRERGSGASLYLQRDGRVVRGTGLPRSNLDAPGCGQNSSAPRPHVARHPDLLVQPGWGSSVWTWGRCTDDLPNQGSLGVWGADGHASLTGEGVMGRGKSPPLGSMPRRPDRGGWHADGNYCGWADNLGTCECYCQHKLVPTGGREGDVDIGQVTSAAAPLPLRLKMRAGDRYRGKESGSRMRRVDAEETTRGTQGQAPRLASLRTVN